MKNARTALSKLAPGGMKGQRIGMTQERQKKAAERWGGALDKLPEAPDEEQAARQEMLEVRRMLVDASAAPMDTGDIRFSPHGFVVCFESREQKIELLQAIGMHQYGDKYLLGPDLCLVLGVDLEKGCISKPKAGASGLKIGGPRLSLGGMQLKPLAGVGKQKPEVGEKLKSIRADERQVAKYIEWTSDPEYWFFVSFWTQEDAERFLSILGIAADKGWQRPYVWCREFAAALGVTLTPCPFQDRVFTEQKRDKRLCALVE